jgi:hypothetical protein
MATVKLIVHAAQGLPVMDSKSKLCDAYVSIRLDDETLHSPTVYSTRNPTFKYYCKFDTPNLHTLQEDPLEIRVYDKDKIMDDLIGTVFIDLNSMLASSTNPRLEAWFPIVDPMEGLHGELHVSVWIKFHAAANSFVPIVPIIPRPLLVARRTARAFNAARRMVLPRGIGRMHSLTSDLEGVVMWAASRIDPALYRIIDVYGLVDELLFKDDPEQKRLTYVKTITLLEARAALLFKLSGKVRRQLTKKVLELGCNCVLGYREYFDVDDTNGIVVRAFGTPCVMIQVDENHACVRAPRVVARRKKKVKTVPKSDEPSIGVSLQLEGLTPLAGPAIPASYRMSPHTGASAGAEGKLLPLNMDADGHGVRNTPFHGGMSPAHGAADLGCSPPLVTPDSPLNRPRPPPTEDPEGLHADGMTNDHMDGVPAESDTSVVKHHTKRGGDTTEDEEGGDDDEEGHDGDEGRYDEEAEAEEYDDAQYDEEGNEVGLEEAAPPGIGVAAIGAEKWANNDPNDRRLRYLKDTTKLSRYQVTVVTLRDLPAGTLKRIAGAVSARSVKQVVKQKSRATVLQERDQWWAELREELQANTRAMGCNLVLGYQEAATYYDDVAVLSVSGTAAVLESWIQLTRSPRELVADAQHRHKHARLCRLAHIPGDQADGQYELCSECGNEYVPDVLLLNCELPGDVPTEGNPKHLEIRIAKDRPKIRLHAAQAVSQVIPFLEYAVHRQLLFRLRMERMNCAFNFHVQLTMNDETVVATAIATGVRIPWLPVLPLPQIHITEDAVRSDPAVERVERLWAEWLAQNATANLPPTMSGVQSRAAEPLSNDSMAAPGDSALMQRRQLGPDTPQQQPQQLGKSDSLPKLGGPLALSAEALQSLPDASRELRTQNPRHGEPQPATAAAAAAAASGASSTSCSESGSTSTASRYEFVMQVDDQEDADHHLGMLSGMDATIDSLVTTAPGPPRSAHFVSHGTSFVMQRMYRLPPASTNGPRGAVVSALSSEFITACGLEARRALSLQLRMVAARCGVPCMVAGYRNVTKLISESEALLVKQTGVVLMLAPDPTITRLQTQHLARLARKRHVAKKKLLQKSASVLPAPRRWEQMDLGSTTIALLPPALLTNASGSNAAPHPPVVVVHAPSFNAHDAGASLSTLTTPLLAGQQPAEAPATSASALGPSGEPVGALPAVNLNDTKRSHRKNSAESSSSSSSSSDAEEDSRRAKRDRTVAIALAALAPFSLPPVEKESSSSGSDDDALKRTGREARPQTVAAGGGNVMGSAEHTSTTTPGTASPGGMLRAGEVHSPLKSGSGMILASALTNVIGISLDFVGAATLNNASMMGIDALSPILSTLDDRGVASDLLVTPLSYVPMRVVTHHHGRISQHFIRRCSTKKESTLGSFWNSTLFEAESVVAALARGLGGNAVVDYAVAYHELEVIDNKTQALFFSVSGHAVTVVDPAEALGRSTRET